MQDPKTQWRDERVVDSDATSKETLADLEKNEKSSNSDSEGAARESELPSPDGGDNEVSKRTDEVGPR